MVKANIREQDNNNTLLINNNHKDNIIHYKLSIIPNVQVMFHRLNPLYQKELMDQERYTMIILQTLIIGEAIRITKITSTLSKNNNKM